MAPAKIESQTIEEGIVRLALPRIEGPAGHLAPPANVYLIDGPSAALINAGHPSHRDLLLGALRDHSVDPSQIERIVATSWGIDIVGGATHFPRADLFLLSPDMEAPRDYDAHVDEERRELLSMAKGLANLDEQFSRRAVEEAIDVFLPRMTRDLQFAPLRNGHFLRLADLQLEVLSTAGPHDGHLSLFDAQRKLLFSGDFAMSGLPHRIDDTQAYLVSLERMVDLPAERILPNRGRVFEQGRWTLSRAANFLNNFLSNAPAAMVRTPTVSEFVARDRALTADEPIELLAASRLYRSLFDELVRTDTIAADGRGMARRYGVDVDDPRAQVRPQE